MRQQPGQIGASVPQLVDEPIDARNGIGESRAIWLPTVEAARYTGRTVAGFRRWAGRHGLKSIGGDWARRDIDRARLTPRKRPAMHPNSLRNLRRHTDECATERSSRPLNSVHEGA